MEELTFQIHNLGVIKKGEFTQKPLTIFCGPNNSGKTWIMYSLYYCHGCMAQLARRGREDKSLKLSPAAFNLGTRRTALLHHASKEHIDLGELLTGC